MTHLNQILRTLLIKLNKEGVVPYDGAGTFDDHVTDTLTVTPGAEYGVVEKEHVFHTSFFE